MRKSLIRLCQRSTEPCGVTDEKSSIYANPALRNLLHFPRCVNSEEGADVTPSDAITVFETQEKQARDQKLPLCILNILPYGSEKKIQPYLFDFFPLFNEKGQCIGTFFYARLFPFFSLLECTEKKLPRTAAVQKPNKIFTEKEWDIVFFLLNRLGSKEIAKILHSSHRTIENRLQIIYENLGVHNSEQLRNFCERKGINNYIPSKFLPTGSHVISFSSVSQKNQF